jgi:hypothetical protein
VQGFAPAAEIHACRIFPGGRFSDLVSALDYCMEQGVDVVNLSLGGGDPSRIVEERIIRAKSMGIACIVAAGNSGGPVQFPASTQHVLAVAAMGRWGEFPEDSYHATQALEGFTPGSTPNGYFPARFSCFGPEIDVCAPGVAIVSSLPPDGFGAWDGTSMAAPHVAGMAALVLAHHPDFRGAFRARDARRVERLFQIIKETATPLGFGDTARTGAGMPDVPRALGLEAAASSVGAAGTAAAADAIRRLLAAAAGGAPAAFAPQSIVAPKLPPHFDFGFHPPRRPSRPVPVPGARWNPTDWKNLLARGPARTSGASPRPGISLQSAGPMPAPPDTDGAAASNGGGHPLQEMRANMMRAGLL